MELEKSEALMKSKQNLNMLAILSKIVGPEKIEYEDVESIIESMSSCKKPKKENISECINLK